VSGVFERDGQIALAVRSATDAGGLPIGTDLLATGGDPPGDGFSDHSTFSARYSEAPPGAGISSDASLELLFELTSPDGRPGRLVTLFPALPWSDPHRYFDVRTDGARAEIMCRVEFERGCEHELELQGEVPEDLTLTGATVALREPGTGGARRTRPREETGFFSTHPDGFFDVRFHVAGEEAFADQSELLSLTLTGRFVGGVSPVESMTWGAVRALYQN
jgi:hypothetical protein